MYTTEQSFCSGGWLDALAQYRHLGWRQTSRVNRQEMVTTDIWAGDKHQDSTPGDGGRKPRVMWVRHMAETGSEG